MPGSLGTYVHSHTAHHRQVSAVDEHILSSGLIRGMLSSPEKEWRNHASFISGKLWKQAK